VRKWVVGICLVLASILVPLLALALFYLACVVAKINDIGFPYPKWIDGGRAVTGVEVLAVLAAALALLIRFGLDISLTAPLRLYRQGLRNTFICRSDNEKGEANLSSIDPENLAPYPLINCTVNLPTSGAVTLRERKSDFFLISRSWIGSPAIGYHPSRAWKM